MNPWYPPGVNGNEPELEDGVVCPACSSDEVSEEDDIVEDTDGRCHPWHGFVCLACGRSFK